MPVIDSHAHIWGEGFVPPAFFAKAAKEWAAKATDRRADMIMPKLLNGIVDPDGDDFIANMDRAGVDASMVMMIDVGAPVFGEDAKTPPEAQIEFYAALQKRHPKRLHCHVAVDFRRPDHLDLIRRGVVHGGLKGIGEITPDGFSAADDAIRPVMMLANDLGVPVQIHTRTGVWTDFAGTDFSERNPVHPVHIARLAKALPELKIILCHAGFPHWWHRAAELIADLPNCVLDISNWNEVFHHDEAEMIARLAAWRGLVGAERILFASDQASGPRFTGERSKLPDWVSFIRALPENATQWGYCFSEAEAKAILGENAARIYGFSQGE
ncbi:amidohydrolase family protein [Limoniibacter endophyticus]|uniref:amidohydrolase family protein n=1 Tax=Limoniibacter endophyticus TaxID=1565040 RepID=UPI00167A2D94|nr:amidohydrolase family protein [Limoniibacter endophyticus]